MKHLITYCEEKTYENPLFNSSKLQTINLENQISDQFNKGLSVSEYDLKKTPLNIDNFVGLPALFDVKMGSTAVTDAYKKRKRLGIPVDVNQIKQFEFPKREDEAVLILGARFISIDRENPRTKKKEKWKGITFNYIDTNLYLSSDDVVSIQGIPIVSASIENKALNIFQKLPAYYILETGSSRTSKGGEIDQILGVKMVGDFDLKKFLQIEENKQQ